MLALLPVLFLPADLSLLRPDRAPIDGYVIDMKITTEGQTPPADIGMTLKVAGDKMRVEMDLSRMMPGGGGGNEEMMNGAYMLLQENGKMAMILPNMRNPMSGGTGFGMTMDISAIAGMAPQGGPPRANDVQVNVEDLGAGGQIAGHATRKYRITTKANVNGNPMETVSESWFATDLSGAEEGFKKFSSSFGAQFSGNSAKEIQDAMMSKMPKGFPMRSVTEISEGSSKTKATMEVTRIEKSSFEGPEFEVPTGIQLMDMSGMMGGRGRRGGR
jgi:hypothetical protein